MCVCVCVCVYRWVNIYFSQEGRVFVYDQELLGLISNRVISKTQKMVLDTPFT